VCHLCRAERTFCRAGELHALKITGPVRAVRQATHNESVPDSKAFFLTAALPCLRLIVPEGAAVVP
jgi:hypothetical protein